MRISPALAEKLDRSWFNPGHLERKTILDSLMEIRKYVKGLLLDVGCRNRPYDQIFPNVTRYVGLDLRVTTNKNGPDVCGDAMALPFKSDVFDTVLSTQVLEHVPEPKKMIEEAWRVLKKGGYLIVTAPMSWEIHEEPHDYYRYTKYGLGYLVKSASFRVKLLRARRGKWRVIGQKLSHAFFYSPEPPKYILSSTLKRIFCAGIQAIFNLLDNISKDERETLGYVLVAQK